MIEADRLSRRFGGRLALDQVSFRIEPGAAVALLGENGAGKTTCLRLLAGVLAPSAGSARADGIDLAVGRAARARIGYLAESSPLPPELRAGEYLAHRAALKGIARAERAARIGEAAAHAGAEPHLDRICGQLSRGERQRVGLAEALLGRPAALLLDEPTEGLDPAERRALLDRVRTLARDRAVLLSTHVTSEAAEACGRALTLSRGRLAGDQPIDGRACALLVRGASEVLATVARALGGLDGAQVARSPAGQGAARFVVRGPRDLRGEAARAVIAAGGELCALEAALPWPDAEETPGC